jgi:hypothetical protein
MNQSRSSYRDRIVLSAECGSFKTHEAHILKRGFLGIGRRKCEGYVHRHIMQLDPIQLFGVGRPRFLFTVNWKCHCGVSWSIEKKGFYEALLGRSSQIICERWTDE